MLVRTPGDVAALFRDRRRALGWSQGQLAARVGASRQWVVDLERGKPRLEIGLVLRVADALGLSVRLDAAESGPARPTALVPVDIDAVVDRARRRT